MSFKKALSPYDTLRVSEWGLVDNYSYQGPLTDLWVRRVSEEPVPEAYAPFDNRWYEVLGEHRNVIAGFMHGNKPVVITAGEFSSDVVIECSDEQLDALRSQLCAMVFVSEDAAGRYLGIYSFDPADGFASLIRLGFNVPSGWEEDFDEELPLIAVGTDDDGEIVDDHIINGHVSVWTASHDKVSSIDAAQVAYQRFRFNEIDAFWKGMRRISPRKDSRTLIFSPHMLEIDIDSREPEPFTIPDLAPVSKFLFTGGMLTDDQYTLITPLGTETLDVAQYNETIKDKVAAASGYVKVLSNGGALRGWATVMPDLPVTLVTEEGASETVPVFAVHFHSIDYLADNSGVLDDVPKYQVPMDHGPSLAEFLKSAEVGMSDLELHISGQGVEQRSDYLSPADVLRQLGCEGIVGKGRDPKTVVEVMLWMGRHHNVEGSGIDGTKQIYADVSWSSGTLLSTSEASIVRNMDRLIVYGLTKKPILLPRSTSTFGKTVYEARRRIDLNNMVKLPECNLRPVIKSAVVVENDPRGTVIRSIILTGAWYIDRKAVDGVRKDLMESHASLHQISCSEAKDLLPAYPVVFAAAGIAYMDSIVTGVTGQGVDPSSFRALMERAERHHETHRTTVCGDFMIKEKKQFAVAFVPRESE